MQIVDQDQAQSEWRPWEPPMWLVALGLTVALMVGFAVAGQVQDPRTTERPTPSTCVPTAVERQPGVSYVWSTCP
ncbi:MAG: hypothetical protein E6I64_08555 [Chloroflexi bacterium]|nr:MAG: hypothetical protein E6I64_08555 [Chloroflexota bacterium]